jgi:hypothetical protein
MPQAVEKCCSSSSTEAVAFSFQEASHDIESMRRDHYELSCVVSVLVTAAVASHRSWHFSDRRGVIASLGCAYQKNTSQRDRVLNVTTLFRFEFFTRSQD